MRNLAFFVPLNGDNRAPILLRHQVIIIQRCTQPKIIKKEFVKHQGQTHIKLNNLFSYKILIKMLVILTATSKARFTIGKKENF